MSKLLVNLDIKTLNIKLHPLTPESRKSTRNTKKPVPVLPKMRKAKNICTDFRIFYDRGDIPIRIIHTSSHNKIQWRINPAQLDLKQYMPIFIDGLREKIDPYRFLAIMGTFDLIETPFPYFLSKMFIMFFGIEASTIIFCLTAYWITGWTIDALHFIRFCT